MHMIGHDDVCVDKQPFVLLAISPAFKKNFFVNISRKQIDPAYHGKGYEAAPIWIMEFVFAAHDLKITALV